MGKFSLKASHTIKGLNSQTFFRERLEKENRDKSEVADQATNCKK